MLNIRALFSRGYKLVQTGIIDFDLVEEVNYIKTVFYKEVLDIRDWLV